MNAKTLGLLLLTAVAICLAGFLWKTIEEDKQERQKLTEEIHAKSNEVVRTVGKLSELQSVNTHLETTLERKSDELSTYSNKLNSASVQLAKTEQQAKEASAAAEAEIAKRNSRIAELTGEKDDLTKKMDGLNLEISGLNNQIKDTEAKLSASEGDRALLEKELKRLLAEKAELERRFNDLALLNLSAWTYPAAKRL
jgi:chromosome segregation ATPase